MAIEGNLLIPNREGSIFRTNTTQSNPFVSEAETDYDKKKDAERKEILDTLRRASMDDSYFSSN